MSRFSAHVPPNLRHALFRSPQMFIFCPHFTSCRLGPSPSVSAASSQPATLPYLLTAMSLSLQLSSQLLSLEVDPPRASLLPAAVLQMFIDPMLPLSGRLSPSPLELNQPSTSPSLLFPLPSFALFLLGLASDLKSSVFITPRFLVQPPKLVFRLFFSRFVCYTGKRLGL